MLCGCIHTRMHGGDEPAKAVVHVELSRFADGHRPAGIRKELWALCPACAERFEAFLDGLGPKRQRG